jgi:hypothetical protein
VIAIRLRHLRNIVCVHYVSLKIRKKRKKNRFRKELKCVVISKNMNRKFSKGTFTNG